MQCSKMCFLVVDRFLECSWLVIVPSNPYIHTYMPTPPELVFCVTRAHERVGEADWLIASLFSSLPQACLNAKGSDVRSPSG